MRTTEFEEILEKIKEFCLWYIKKTNNPQPPTSLIGDFVLIMFVKN